MVKAGTVKDDLVKRTEAARAASVVCPQAHLDAVRTVMEEAAGKGLGEITITRAELLQICDARSVDLDCLAAYVIRGWCVEAEVVRERHPGGAAWIRLSWLPPATRIG